MIGIILLVLRLLMVLALYTFIGWAFLLIWGDIRQQGDLLLKHQIPSIKLMRQDQGDPRSYSGTLPEIIVGRDPACDFVLDDPTVSARHARLSHHHIQWWIEDLGSTNGTFLNQVRVTTPLVIISDDELCFGQIKVLISIESGEKHD
jgi:hypothetical protein